jgi:hypothetical protein
LKPPPVCLLNQLNKLLPEKKDTTDFFSILFAGMFLNFVSLTQNFLNHDQKIPFHTANRTGRKRKGFKLFYD